MARFYGFNILPEKRLNEKQAEEVERGFKAAHIEYKKFEIVPHYFYTVYADGEGELAKLLDLLKEHGFEADYQEVQWRRVEVDEDE